MSVKAKFKATMMLVIPEQAHSVARFAAVQDGCDENKSFAKYTPSGYIEMSISPETPAAKYFEEGAEYYVTFEKVIKQAE